jgi:hypothetical protein
MRLLYIPSHGATATFPHSQVQLGNEEKAMNATVTDRRYIKS